MSRHDLSLALVVTYALPTFVWFGLYPLAGYGRETLFVAQALTLAAGVALVAVTRVRWRHLGLGLRFLEEAAVIGLVAYAAIMLVAAGLNAVFDAGLPLVRSRYDGYALLDNWLLTAFPESLLFAGVLFTLTRARIGVRWAWAAIVLVSLAFALWHLPGYLAIGYGLGTTLGRLALNAVSWLVFGSLYALSGNLWLVVVAHAATDYGLSPLVTDQPVLGLLFMAVLMAGAWWRARRRSRAVPPARVVA